MNVNMDIRGYTPYNLYEIKSGRSAFLGGPESDLIKMPLLLLERVYLFPIMADLF